MHNSMSIFRPIKEKMRKPIKQNNQMKDPRKQIKMTKINLDNFKSLLLLLLSKLLIPKISHIQNIRDMKERNKNNW